MYVFFKKYIFTFFILYMYNYHGTLYIYKIKIFTKEAYIKIFIPS